MSRLRGLDLSNVQFGTVYSDHMFCMEFQGGSWGKPAIRPYGPLFLPPNISALQYGISVFEGLKAHQSPHGEALLFRPSDNARRLNRSGARLAMPEIPNAVFLDGLRTLIDLDRAWIPRAGEGALYIRPSFFSIDESIRVKPAERFQFVIFTCPFGTYYSAPIDILVTEKYVRAFPGGTGDVKPAGNYAAALLADMEARDAGFGSVLWLDAQNRRFVEECGVMNIFFVVDGKVVTPQLTGTILPGVTRDSVITLIRDMGVEVTERLISLEELITAYDQGRLAESFGTGTAATLSHIKRIRYRDRDLVLPEIAERKIGPAVRERLVAIATGAIPDPYGWVVTV
jgi:branched-chain amino acid aminotransferase